MKTLKKIGSFYLSLALLSTPAFAGLKVIATTSDLRSIASEVAGSYANVDSIAKGTQDPHFIEAKPSFMVKASQADLVISNGLDLEIGWLPSIITGARNPKIRPGEKGNLEIGSSITPIDIPSGKITRAEGDVHPSGNPHFTLDPVRAGAAAILIGKRLGEIDPEHAAEYTRNAASFDARLKEKLKDWTARIGKSGVKAVITYHKTLTYFLARFNLENPAILEPKPGVPPTSGHIIGVIQLIKEKKIPLILVENYFDPTVTQKIKHEVPSVRTQTVPVSVDGAGGMNRLEDVYENLVKAVEGNR